MNQKQDISKNFKQRAFVLVSSISVWLFAFLIFKPWIVGFYSDYFKSFDDGSRLFLKHTFIFSTPTAIVCLLWIVLLQKLKLIEPIKISLNKKIFLSSVLWGLGVAIFTLAIAPLLGMDYGYHFNPWSIAGNFTSNFCEEIIFRGLLLFAIWSALDSKTLAIILTGIIFGLTHEQYPWLIKVYIALIGSLLSYLTTKEKNILPAIIVHDISDWILDLFL